MEENAINTIHHLQDIYRMFADDISKDIFLKRLVYSVSGDSAHIADMVRKYRPEFVDIFHTSIPKEQKYVIWGAGSFGQKCFPYVVGDERFIAFCDGDASKQENGFCEYPVISPDELFLPEYRGVAVAVATTNYEDEIVRLLLERGKSEKDIYRVGSVMKQMSVKQYFDEEFIQFSEKEVFVDAGSYDLGSVINLYKLCPQLEKAYAFEPDADNYAVCQRIKEEKGMDWVTLFPYGTWDRKTTLRFHSQANISSCIGEDGETVVETISIDGALQGKDVTYIKIDVEGAEYHSLMGARKTIQRCRPKLAVCVYHKPEDIILLLMYIKSLVSDYKFYLRHYSHANSETVLYAIPEKIA